jgi:hypothetical protein
MTIKTCRLIYPDGDSQEVDHRLCINAVVDLNGYLLRPPLPTFRMIAYRVYKISTTATRGEETTSYFLELLNRDMIMEYASD